MASTITWVTRTLVPAIRKSTLDALMPPEEWQERADASYGRAFQEESTKTQFVKEVVASLTSPETTSITSDEISRLCNTIEIIRKSFRSVRASLLAFDYERFANTRGDVLQLLPKWDALSMVSDLHPF
jgi:hypothetical protein